MEGRRAPKRFRKERLRPGFHTKRERVLELMFCCFLFRSGEGERKAGLSKNRGPYVLLIYLYKCIFFGRQPSETVPDCSSWVASSIILSDRSSLVLTTRPEVPFKEKDEFLKEIGLDRYDC